MSVGGVLSAVLVAVLWGVTNPFMKKGGEGIEKIQQSNLILQFLAELRYLFVNWQVGSKTSLQVVFVNVN